MINAGKHRTHVHSAELRKSTKEGGGAPYALLSFNIGNESVEYFGSFSETVISTGKNAGRRVGELTAETLVALGWDGDLTKLSEIEGVECSIVVEHVTDDKGTRARVKFVNPLGGGAPVEASDVALLNKSFRATILEAKKARKTMPTKVVAAPAVANGTGGGGYSNADYPPEDGDMPFAACDSTRTTERWWKF